MHADPPSTLEPVLAVFIPAYEAEDTLRRVVERIPRKTMERLRLVFIQDDASTDATAVVAEAIAAGNPKIMFRRNEQNLGYGGTIKRAFKWLEAEGIDAFVMVHSDLQHDPELIEAMLAPIIAGAADIVLGSRMMAGTLGGMPLHRWVANRLLTRRLNGMLGLGLTDYHTGFVAASCQALRTIRLESCSDGHELTAEVLVRSAACGLRVAEIQVPTHYDDWSRSCTLRRSFCYTRYVLRVTSRNRRLSFAGGSETQTMPERTSVGVDTL